jgi:phosphoglycolate phosphatase-like HAD superfamily hydrolase
MTTERQSPPNQATPDEMLARGQDPDLVFQAELAADVQRAVHAPGTAIELVSPLPPDLTIRYAIFDHDGTISTLRHGWEQIMEPVMMRAIFGRTDPRADPAVHVRILQQVREFIDKTTGIQTLLQMHGLSQMVRAAGLVPAGEVLDAAGYKRIYNEALMNLVERRLDRLRSGELGVNHYTMKNAVPFLGRLHEAGIRLYLASGTDEADVIREAEQLGYAALFEGRIYGASHDITHDAKLMVLNRIIGEIGSGQASHIVTFGDGPVEVRETRRRGGVTVGLASNEVQRCGLQLEKRTRVIRAGAHLVVPDFSDMETLLGLLRIGVGV